MTAACGLSALLLTTVAGHARTPQAQAQQPAPAPAQPPAPAPAPAAAQGAPAGQPAPASGDQQPPIFRAGINFVRVDVIVSDSKGNSIDDLRPEDFEVVEQGKPQAIETFKLISLDGGRSGVDGRPREIRTDADEETEAARDDVRLFAVFLDDYHVRRESSMWAREQISRFVDTQIGPSDMIGLMYPLESTVSVRMTRNHDAISKAITQFMGRKFDYTPRNEIEERYAYYPTQTVEQIRNDVSLSAIKALIVHMGGLKEGRKSLILVTEGYSSIIPPQMRNDSAAMPGIGNPVNSNPDAGNNALEDRAMTFAQFDMDDRLREVTDLANRNNVAIYAVDPRGLATNEFGIDQNIGQQTDRAYLNSSMETLRTLALNTDGRAIINRNDLATGMRQIVRDSSAYYLLGYNSTFTATDGKFHEIKVRVKRPGVQVRARKGYWAFTDQDAKKALAPPTPEMPKAFSSALASIAPPSRSRVVRTWVGTDRGAGGRTKVTVLWEPITRAAGDPVRPGDAPARVTVTATAPDGSPYYRGKLPDAPSTPAGGSATFEVPPGKMQLRFSVENAENDVLDSEVKEVDVPNLAAAVAIATPRLYRARTMRDYQLAKTDPQVRPTAAREFSRTERVFLRVSAYAGSEPATITARMLNRAGQPISTLPVTSSAAGDSHDIDLTLTTIPPGEYLVEVTAAAGAGPPVQEVIGIRITS